MLTDRHILQVNELTKKVRFILESELNTVWLTGEISNFIAASSGHWYLSLKDSKSQVKCAMFKGNNRYVRIKPGNGQQVLVKARVSLYEPRGDFQLIIEQMEDAGEGLLRQQYEALKAKLTAQGIFDVSKKQPLPSVIHKVGVVTSPTGAAVKDVISVLARRNPAIEVVIYPALVQGELAPNDIIASIDIANARCEVDVLVVGRGGGSLEDLWCFNDEHVVQAISRSHLPVISAVGHEIDTTLSDYVADVRAPTPSAAAELVSGDQSELAAKIQQLRSRLAIGIVNKLKLNKQQSEVASAKLAKQHPERMLMMHGQRSDELSTRLKIAMQQQMRERQVSSLQLSQRISHLSPARAIESYVSRVEYLKERLISCQQHQLTTKRNAFAHIVEQLNIVSPLATIARGYSVTRSETGTIVKSTEQVVLGDDISVQVSDGIIKATVRDKHYD
ncbi:exodeoxyribonuclease VII large subunit [Thalassotalea euphylliae]|uniref:exodeoxyribonuclease VII large subunit n=1 Tax=Thalassotalea euphylliae TaxID=1655234 RepID=UPI00363B87C8